MVWLGVCSAGLTKIVILDKGTVNHERYIREVLLIALKCGNEMMGNDWMFQQDGAGPHRQRKHSNGVKTISLHFYRIPDGRQIHQI